ncbi:MAG: ankyrin repeat domain-containing protein [Acidobacteria bacterium]|nr:ankyrin repeat domain-containing protein [Acidobacteriota bacterium]
MTNARAVFAAAEEGDSALVARLLASGAWADERAAHGGETPLMRAAARGHEDVVRVLLEAGAEPSARRADGFTPLILAVFFGHEGVVRLLVERGADASARTGLGTTAARWAEARGFTSMAKVLREAEASRPPAVVKPATVEREEATVQTKRATITPDEVEIFFRGRAGRKEEPEVYAEGEHPSNATAAGVSVRQDGQLPAHPSTSTVGLGHFLRSWQGFVGVLFLLAAFGVAVYALVAKRPATRSAAQPAPTPVAPQAAVPQVPAPPQPTPSPSPVFPTPDPQGIFPVPDQTYAVPNGGMPYYVSPAPVNNIPSDVPRELTVVSEGGAPSTQDAGQAGRRPGPGASPTPARGDARNENSSDAGAARTPEPETPRPAPTAPASQPPPPAPQDTPRAKVIQWPPQ